LLPFIFNEFELNSNTQIYDCVHGNDEQVVEQNSQVIRHNNPPLSVDYEENNIDGSVQPFHVLFSELQKEKRSMGTHKFIQFKQSYFISDQLELCHDFNNHIVTYMESVF